MQISQEEAEHCVLRRATAAQRLWAGAVFACIFGVFLLGWLMGHYHFTLWPFACGFKQKYGLPCPTCGMTTALIAFSRGDIIRSFWTQPAAAFFCCIAVIGALFSLLIGVGGVYFPLLEQYVTGIKLRYVAAAAGAVIVAGWAVTLARAISEHGF